MISHKSSTFHKATLFSLLFLTSFLLFARSSQAQVATLFASPSGVSSGATTALTWTCPGGTSSATLNPPGFVVGLNGTQNSAVLTNNSIFSIVCAFVPVPVSAYTTVNVSGTGGQSCNSGTPVGGACGPAGDVCYGNSLWQCWSSTYPVIYLNSNPGSVTYIVGGSPPPPQSFAISNLNSSNSTAYWSASSDQSWCHVAGPGNPPSFVYSGTSSFGSPANITLYVDTISTPGSYACHVTFTNQYNAPNNAAISNVPYTYTLNYTVLAAAVPVVTITANPTSGIVGVVNPALTWSATNNPTSCTASGDWSGAKATSGNNVSQGVLNSVKTYNYVLTCSNAAGSGSASAQVVVSNSPVPPSVISFTATPNSITLGGSSTLDWRCGGGATSGTVNPGGFSGLNNSQSVSPAITTTYTLTCSEVGFLPDATAQQTVTVGAIPTYTLTVNKSVGGTVVSNVGGISCGNTCSQTYPKGTLVTLTATPISAYWKFVGWTGDCSGTNACTLTVNSAKTVSAVFAPVPFQYQEF